MKTELLSRTARLFAPGPSILCRDDLPVPVSLQPGVCPDQAPRALRSIALFPDTAFCSVDNGEIVAEKMNLRITQAAPMSFVF